ncbi:MAG TPA: hypothetical protein VJ820_09700 [Propionibacteriaceae bacterium]|nr:hypothetical protein [Propionibacteriaceae bacterium]
MDAANVDPPQVQLISSGAPAYSDGATGAGVMLRRVMALHTQAGDSLHGMATDYYTDGVTTNGSNVLTQPSTQTGIPVGHCC